MSLIYERTWMQAEGVTPSSTQISVMQFNLLAQSLTAYDDFIKAPPGTLDWEYRSVRLLAEIMQCGADVLCLQECDQASYEAWFAPQLEKQGYALMFLKKANKSSKDGLVLAYRLSELELRETVTDSITKGAGQVFILALLHHRESGLDFVVATTHLKATKTLDGERVRLDQVTALLARISAFASERAINTVIFTADLNAQPDSPVYPALAYPTVLAHPLGLTSAYGLAGASSEPAYTTWKVRPPSHEARMTIDFIFFTSATLSLVATYQLPELEYPGLPNALYSSDHLALAAHFVFRK
jgi:mRNA deadenylase 3'-5' endonuclease subunit Ccr4